jgi:hypothetical protein
MMKISHMYQPGNIIGENQEEELAQRTVGI